MVCSWKKKHVYATFFFLLKNINNMFALCDQMEAYTNWKSRGPKIEPWGTPHTLIFQIKKYMFILSEKMCFKDLNMVPINTYFSLMINLSFFFSINQLVIKMPIKIILSLRWQLFFSLQNPKIFNLQRLKNKLWKAEMSQGLWAFYL